MKAILVLGCTRALYGIVLSTLAFLCLVNCQRDRSLTRVRISVPRSITYIPIYLARELNYYRDEGLDVVLEDAPGGTKSLQAMFGGSVDLCGSFLELSIQLASEGRKVQSFLTILDRPGMVLLASPSSKRTIGKVEDLRGAVVGVSTPGSASHLFLQYLLARHSVPANEVNIVSVGLGATGVAALEHGQVDAVVLTGSAITFVTRRFPTVSILADGRTAEGVKQIYGVDTYPAHDLLAPTGWLSRNPATASKVARSVFRAMQYMREHSPEEIRSHIPEQSRSSDPEADYEALRATIPMLSQDGLVKPEGAVAARQFLAVISDKVRSSSIDLSSTYTNAFVQTK